MGSINKEGMKPKPRRKHSKEFKLEAVRLSQQPGMSVTQVADDLGISRSMLFNWTRKLKVEQSDAFRGNGNRTHLLNENEVLNRKIRQLEMERYILKKATTWFAKESE